MSWNPRFKKNKHASVRGCWKLDLVKCFGVLLLVNFCVAKVKGTTNILTSAEQYRRITRNGFVKKATFLCRLVCFERYANIRRHTRYIKLTEPLPSINSQLNVYFERKRNTPSKLTRF